MLLVATWCPTWLSYCLQNMPIGAQEWRVRTGLLNACHTVKAVSESNSQSSHGNSNYCSALPPPNWKGWRALVLMSAAPLLYRVYTFVMAVAVHLTGFGERLNNYEGKSLLCSPDLNDTMSCVRLLSGGHLVITPSYCFISSLVCLLIATVVICGLLCMLLCDHTGQGEAKCSCLRKY